VTVLPAGIVRRLYIDPSELGDPDGQPLRILEGDVRNPISAAQVEIDGPSKLCFDSSRPLWSSARVWVETEATLTLY
jgi:hypothetical protein